MHELQPFNFDSQPIRVVQGDDGEPMFVAADVLAALCLDRKALERLDEDEKGVSSIHTPGGRQSVIVVNEPGLFGLVLGSRKPDAKRFKRWVTHEVLPAIRKTGGYQADAAPAFEVPTTLSGALRLAADQADQIEQQQRQIDQAKPAVEFVEHYVSADSGNKGFRQVAKLLQAKEPALRAFLRDHKIMYQLGGEWMPYQNHIDAGRFVVKTGVAENEHAYNTAKFTPKGVNWIAGLWAQAQLGVAS